MLSLKPLYLAPEHALDCQVPPLDAPPEFLSIYFGMPFRERWRIVSILYILLSMQRSKGDGGSGGCRASAGIAVTGIIEQGRRWEMACFLQPQCSSAK